MQRSPTEQLLDAASRGDVGKVVALIADGADVHGINQAGNQAIHVAAYEGHVSVLEALLKRGADFPACLSVGVFGTATVEIVCVRV